MRSEKYVEPAKTLSIVLLTLVVVAWKIHGDDAGQLAKLREARQILAEWFFYDINLERLRFFEARESEKIKQQGKSLDAVVVPLAQTPVGKSHQIGTVRLTQSTHAARVFIDPKYHQKYRPKQNSFLETTGENERLQAPPEDAVSWSTDISPAKVKWVNDLFAARGNVTLSDVVWALLGVQASKQQIDISDGKSDRELKLSKERYLTSLALDAVYLSANIGASPLEKHASARVVARALNGKAKDTAPTDDEEKVIVGQEFNLLDRHYREAHAKVPFIDLDAEPPVSLFVLTVMSLLCVGIIRSSTMIILRNPQASLEEAWPVFDSPDVVGKVLGAMWVVLIVVAPATIASLGLENAMHRWKMSLSPAFWWPMFVTLATAGLYYGSSTGRVLYLLMRIRWAALDPEVGSRTEATPQGDTAVVASVVATADELPREARDGE